MKLTILHIEDDQDIGSWVSKFLTECGYEVIWITSGQEAMKHMERVDLVILDIMLPGLDGYTIGQRLKQKYPNTPVMMLSARTSMEDKLHGLTFADDYMTKPYHPDELAARIQVLVRRLGVVSPEIIQVMHLQIDQKANRILNINTNADIVLTGKQFHIFMYLLDHMNHILTKKQIYEAVWGDPYIEGDKTLMVHIRHLREKIELDASNPQIIETIRGIGYRMRS
ncbi:response regulator transcription factor [Fredinandcohnia sp. QZ13]|uniref:response regulator transcription factor n=1 Tax=Fredinandcohnia sp. QZ13 TaxID=3073144 RepID=UPI0028536DB2|nr:response regulator transcription factor [Fredinandcohnia sp. QZ13]MDR4886818.1 response regulator transcription factor [Fredinandcohnia sp. QZ13]